MDQLTEEQLAGVQSVRESLIEARTRLERLRLPDSVMSTSWARISNAHADLGRTLEIARMRERTAKKAAG
jgi:hypothetical protein